MIELLSAPIEDLIAALGTGLFPADSPSTALHEASSGLSVVAEVAVRCVGTVGQSWSGAAATAAEQKVHDAVGAAHALTAHGDELGALLARAIESVKRGAADLTVVLESFLSVAAGALPTLATPAGQTALVAVAAEHLDRALAIAARVRAEMDACAAQALAVTQPPPVPEPAVTAATAPAAVDPVASTVLEAVRAASTAPAPTSAASWSGYSGAASVGPEMVDDPESGARGHRAYDPLTGGRGVEITLPDGSTALAPNAQAASAVRTALSLQGTPYVWGGTSPGTGLDCSGLTQYAYGQAGVDLPRLAQEQDIGTPVAAENLLPGDLAVWDGHVAMVVGNGQLIEAGDPVELGPIRTTNSGMGFHGFYRPTE